MKNIPKFAIALLLVMLIASVGVLFYLSDVSSEKTLYESLENNKISRLKDLIRHEFEMAVTDLTVLSQYIQLEWTIDGDNEHTRNEFANIFLTVSKTKKLYGQIRYIDKTGMEIIRINYRDGQAVIVPDNKLQSKANRYYFKDTFNLERGQLFVSPLDLNIEKGKVEIPFRPVIRFGTPVFDEDGVKQGVIIINYMGVRILHDLGKKSFKSLGDVMLLNSDGYWLHSPRPEDEWGFMFQDKKDVTFNKVYPDKWKQITGSESGQFTDKDGLFTFTTIFPLLEGWKSSSGSGEAFVPSTKPLNAKGYFWKILSIVPPDSMGISSRKMFARLILLYLLLVGLLALGSWLVDRSFGQTVALPAGNLSPSTLLISTATVIFFSEILVMLVLPFFQPITPLLEAFVDATVMFFLVVPTLYFLMVRPLFYNIKQRTQVEEELQRKGDELTLRAQEAMLSAEVSSALTTVNSEQKILQLCCESIVRNLDTAFARIWTVNWEENVLELQASAGMYTHIDGAHERLPVGKLKIGLIVKDRQPFLTNNALDDIPGIDKEWAKREGMVAFAGYPLIVDDEVMGVIATFSKKPLLESTLNNLSIVANGIAVGMKRLQAENMLKESEKRYRSLVQTANDAIISMDSNGKIISWNDGARSIFGYEEAEIINKPLTLLMPEKFRDKHREGVKRVVLAGESKMAGKTHAVSCLKKDGSEFPVELSFSMINTEKGYQFYGLIHDISKRKQAEDQIKSSLNEKEILLREIHHRVKNNMQVISSLLRMQSKLLKNKDDIHLLEESQNRIKSMALIHEKLYQSKNLAGINFDSYVKSLTGELLMSSNISANKIQVKIDIENIFLAIDSAIPCGLVINELVTNSLKHAFPEGRTGEIKIQMKSSDKGKIELIISDNGVALPDSVDFRKTQSLGLQLVTGIVENQLEGSIELSRTGGTEFKIIFQELKK